MERFCDLISNSILIIIISIILIIFLYLYLKFKNSNDYTEGYNWAAGAILRKEQTIEDILTHVDCSELFGDKNRFDDGAMDAINAIETLTKMN